MRSRGRIFLILLLLAAILTVYYCNLFVERAAEGNMYSDVRRIPFRKVGLVLGTAKYVEGGLENPYYRYRIDAASLLFKEGKVKYLIVSGDNSREDYNEPGQMQEDLIKAGVDSSHIFLDYAGFRTFDSMVRLKEIFSQDSVTVISQRFHNERALYIASREGISALAFNARDVSPRFGFKVKFRERLARVKLFLDYLFGKQPKYLGPKVQIPV
jgi:SanA protein